MNLQSKNICNIARKKKVVQIAVVLQEEVNVTGITLSASKKRKRKKNQGMICDLCRKEYIFFFFRARVEMGETYKRSFSRQRV